MRAGDVHLEAVWIDRPAVICSTTVAAKGIRERIVYTVALEGSSYVIKFGGEPGGRNYFLTDLRSGQSIWICRLGALSRLRPVPSDALIQPRRLATIYSTDYHHRQSRPPGRGANSDINRADRTGHDCRMHAKFCYLRISRHRPLPHILIRYIVYCIR